MVVKAKSKVDGRIFYLYGVDAIILNKVSPTQQEEGILVTLAGCTNVNSAELWFNAAEWTITMEETD